MPNTYFLGVDGGGTQCRVRIRAASGALVAEASGGTGNITQNRTAALDTIRKTISAAADAGGLTQEDLRQTWAGFGLAGVINRQIAGEIAALGWPFAGIAVDDDAYIACLGAHGTANGGIIISGTGSAGLCLVNGARHALGGYGFALGDDGSGAQLGRAALRLALLARDGLAPRTPLMAELLDAFGDDPSAMISWSLSALPRDYAAFVPRIFAAGETGDPAATRLLGEAANAIEQLGRGLLKLGAERLSLFGSVALRLSPYIAGEVQAAMILPKADAVDGAILMAQQQRTASDQA